VGAVVIVEVDESVVSVGALSVGGPGADVGPFFEQDAVEAFDLAVGLRAAWPGLLGGGACFVAGAVPQS
jgi:hypothetical protein